MKTVDQRLYRYYLLRYRKAKRDQKKFLTKMYRQSMEREIDKRFKF